MTKRDAFLMYGALGISALLALAALSIPTSPGPYQWAINDREVKVKLLESRGYTVALRTVEKATIYTVQWKDDNGEPYKSTFSIHDMGDSSPGWGSSGDIVPHDFWYEVGE